MIEIKPLKEKRMNHCLSVANLCYDLALAHHYDPIKAYLAGVFHDIAREVPPEKMIAIAREHDIIFGKEETEEPLLLHGEIAALVMAENYGIGDAEIQNALRRHTVGDEEMTLLDKLLFIADKTEPLRSYPGITALREKAFTDLDQALYENVKNEMAYCIDHGYAVHPKTILLKNALEKEGVK